MIILIDKDNYQNIETSFFSKEELLEKLKVNPFAKFLFFKKENKIVGYLYYSKIYERIEINNIEVLPKYRLNNIASTMLQYLIKNNLGDITLEVRESNILALKLYEKFGFKKVAIRENYYQTENAFLMERRSDKNERCIYISNRN